MFDFHHFQVFTRYRFQNMPIRGRPQIDSAKQKRPMDVWGGGKDTGRFQNRCFTELSSKNFLQGFLVIGKFHWFSIGCLGEGGILKAYHGHFA